MYKFEIVRKSDGAVIALLPIVESEEIETICRVYSLKVEDLEIRPTTVW